MKIALFIILTVLATPLFAQLKTTNDLTLVKEISVKKYTDKKFRATVDIKNKPSDTSGLAGLFVLQVGKGDYDFIPNTAKNIPATKIDTNWHTYNATGTIQSNTQKIWLYVTTKGNGDFSYDNFTLEIEEQPNQWTKLAIPNGNFEESTNPLKDFRNVESLKSKPGIKVSLARHSDTHYLHINATGGKNYYEYGQNTANGKYVNSNGTKIYYETYGTGEPLLLLHGNGGSINAFKAQIEAFAQQYKVIVVDTRAQGKSTDKTSTKLSYDLFAEDMKTLLDTLHLKQVNVLGWSDGGNTGLILASKYPDYVKKLITMGANLNPEETAVSAKILKQTRNDLEKLKAKNYQTARSQILLLSMLLSEPNLLPVDLQKITAKTLVLAGEKDIILENHSRLIAQSIPQAELNILKGQSHSVPQENPKLFNQVVLDFLAKP